jgi:hypothetical protein
LFFSIFPNFPVIYDKKQTERISSRSTTLPAEQLQQLPLSENLIETFENSSFLKPVYGQIFQNISQANNLCYSVHTSQRCSAHRPRENNGKTEPGFRSPPRGVRGVVASFPPAGIPVKHRYTTWASPKAKGMGRFDDGLSGQ